MDPKIKSTVWDDDDFAALDDAGKIIFFWLITCQATNNIGYLEVSRRAFEVDTGRDYETLERVLKGLPRAYVWDKHNGRLRVWIRNYVRHQWPAGCLQPKSRLFPNLRSLYEALPEPFQASFKESYKGLASLFQGALLMEGASKGLKGGAKGPEQHSTDQIRSDQIPQGECEGEPVLPTQAEFLAAFATDEIPPAYLQRRFEKFYEKKTWFNGMGKLIDWRRTVRNYWQEDRATWKPAKGVLVGAADNDSIRDL